MTTLLKFSNYFYPFIKKKIKLKQTHILYYFVKTHTAYWSKNQMHLPLLAKKKKNTVHPHFSHIQLQTSTQQFEIFPIITLLLISLRISGLDDLASVELPMVVEGLQRTKRCQRGDRRWPAEPPPMAKLVWSYQVFGKKSQKKSYLPWVQTGPLYRGPWSGYLSK